MSQDRVAEARDAFTAEAHVAALNDVIARTRYGYRHDPQRCPPGLPPALPPGADRAAIDRCYAALAALPLSELVRGLCEPMNGAFPSEAVVRVVTRSLPEGAELERKYRINTGVPAA